MTLQTLNDLTDLRKMAVTGVADGEVVHVSHHSLSIDQGGGMFMWDPSFVGTTDDSKESEGIHITKFDDNGTFIRPESIVGTSAGRWRRVDAMGDPAIIRANGSAR